MGEHGKPNPGGDEDAPEEVGAAESIQKLDRSSAARGVAWTSLFAVFSRVLFPLAGLYVARHLGPGPLGIGAMLMQIIAISEVLRDAGLTQTYMVEQNVDRKRLGSYMALALAMGVLLAGILVVSTPALTAFFRMPELSYGIPLVAGVVLLNSICTIPAAKMLKEGRIKQQGLIGVVAAGVALAVCIVMVRMGYGFPAIMTQIVVGPIIGNIWIFLASPVTTISFDLAAAKATFKKSGTLLAANLVNNAFLQADVFVVARMLGNDATGLYNTAKNLAYKPAELISFPLAKVLMVAFGQSSDDHVRLARNFTRAITAVVLLVTPIYVMIGLCAEPIIWLLFAEKFVGAIPALSILSLYLGARTLGNVAGHALVPAGKHAWTLYPWSLAILVTAGSLWYFYRLSPVMSLTTVVWCFTAGALCVYLVTVGVAFYFLKPKGAEVARLKQAMGTTLATGLLILAVQWLPVSMYGRLAISVTIVPVIHFSIIGMVFEKNWRAYLHRGGPRQLLRSL